MHLKNITRAGTGVDEAEKALIMLHGRGSSARDILSLAQYLNIEGFAVLAPQAANNTWYPKSFLASPIENEPWLTSALSLLEEIVADLSSKGKSPEHVYFAGFSQGACLTLEFTARNGRRYGGIAAFTGGLIGDRIYLERYAGDFNRTPVFIGSNNPDPHVPAERVKETIGIFKNMNADVTGKLYVGKEHTISEDEINLANELIFQV